MTYFKIFPSTHFINCLSNIFKIAGNVLSGRHAFEFLVFSISLFGILVNAFVLSEIFHLECNRIMNNNLNKIATCLNSIYFYETYSMLHGNIPSTFVGISTISKKYLKKWNYYSYTHYYPKKLLTDFSVRAGRG